MIEGRDLPALLLLRDIARVGSVTAAAEKLGLSQQNASARLRSLEKVVGIKLVDRAARGSTLNADGLLVAEWATPLLEHFEELSRSMTALRDHHREVLIVATSLTIAERLVPNWLARLAEAHPGIHIRIVQQNSAAVVETIRSGDAHLGFVESDEEYEDLSQVVVGSDELVAVVAPTHPWAQGKSVTVNELASTPLVWREPGSGTASSARQSLGDTQIADPAAVLVGNLAVSAAVVNGVAPAILSSLTVADDLALGRLRQVQVADWCPLRQFRAVWTGDPDAPGPGVYFLESALATQ